MTPILEHTRFAAALGLSLLVGSATFANGQDAATLEAAENAEQVAEDVNEAIRAIDPTTGGDSLVVDPSLPSPYGTTVAPPLGADATTVDTSIPDETAEAIPPRGPAVRMISNPQVQAAPPPAPKPATKPKTKKSGKDGFVVKSILPITGTIRYGEWYWDESRAPKTGPLVMTVDLDARVISVFRDGHEIGTAVALLGTKKHPTPLGSFKILTKEKDNVSEKYNNAPMPWSLRLTWDGIMIHGSPVLNGYASHGCVGVPDPFAEKLFGVAKRGDKVIITRGQTLQLGDQIIS